MPSDNVSESLCCKKEITHSKKIASETSDSEQTSDPRRILTETFYRRCEIPPKQCLITRNHPKASPYSYYDRTSFPRGPFTHIVFEEEEVILALQIAPETEESQSQVRTEERR
jgi:hypothetical protein